MSLTVSPEALKGNSSVCLNRNFASCLHTGQRLQLDFVHWLMQLKQKQWWQPSNDPIVRLVGSIHIGHANPSAAMLWGLFWQCRRHRLIQHEHSTSPASAKPARGRAIRNYQQNVNLEVPRRPR